MQWPLNIGLINQNKTPILENTFNRILDNY